MTTLQDTRHKASSREWCYNPACLWCNLYRYVMRQLNLG